MKRTVKRLAGILIMTAAVTITAVGLSMFASNPKDRAVSETSATTSMATTSMATSGRTTAARTTYYKSATLRFDSDYYPFTVNYTESTEEESYTNSRTINGINDTFEVYQVEQNGAEYVGIDSFKCGAAKILAENVQGLSYCYTGTTSHPTLTITLDFVKDTVSLPETPTKEGYRFVGWYYDAAYTRPYDNAPIYADTQLYAKFEINTYTITFDTDGGNVINSMTVNWNTTPTLPTPSKEGHNFLGWYLSDGTKYEGQAVKSNISLTAHWQVKTYTVTFYVEGEVYKTLTVEYGTSFAELVATANAMNLRITTLSADGETSAAQVDCDMTAESMKLTGTDKVMNTVKNNRWYILGGVAGGVILIGAGVAVAGILTKKKRAARVATTVAKSGNAAAKPDKAKKPEKADKTGNKPVRRK